MCNLTLVPICCQNILSHIAKWVYKNNTFCCVTEIFMKLKYNLCGCLEEMIVNSFQGTLINTKQWCLLASMFYYYNLIIVIFALNIFIPCFFLRAVKVRGISAISFISSKIWKWDIRQATSYKQLHYHFLSLSKKQTLYQLEKFNFTLNDLKGILHEYQRTVNNVFNNCIVFQMWKCSFVYDVGITCRMKKAINFLLTKTYKIHNL